MPRRLSNLSVLAVAGCLPLVQGCTVGPRYHPPVVSVPKAWRVTVAEGASLGNEQWWTLLKDPVLQQLVRAAVAHNTDIRTAASQLMQAQAQVVVARAAQFPAISANPSFQSEQLPAGAAGNVLSHAEQFKLYELAGSGSYAADFWGQYRQATAQERENLLASEQSRRNVIIGVVSSVAQDYFQLRTLDLELQQTQETVTAYRKSLDLTTSLFEGGVTSELDVKQAQTALDSALTEIPALQEQIGRQEDALNILLGENPMAVPRGLSIERQPLPPSVPAGLPSQLLERRPDIIEAADRLAAAYDAVDVAQARFFPQLSLTAAGGAESTGLSHLLSAPSVLWDIVAGLTQPIFEGGALVGNLRITKAEQMQALIAYQAAVLTAFQQVNDALISYQRTREQLNAQEALVSAAEDSLNLANLRYQGGVDTYLNVLTAEESLFTGRITLASDRGAVLTALVQLYQALGGGWQA
ncbi:MAG TPA: efflux transporter outer membrane subunit [Steroidobacteraceae bacterium]|nr:efflux transporter outer membrane subunit [Steroidobacteraceae bacterium]